MEQTNMQGGSKVCPCPHHKVMPVLIILFGLTFLLGAVGVFTQGFVMIAWPIIVIAIGLNKLVNKYGMCKCC